MSRIAPTIPVDLNSRRVLVESFATRVVRCDCCPDTVGLCGSCDPATLGAMQFGSMTFRGRSDWVVVRSDVGFGGCREFSTPFADGPFGEDVALILHTANLLFQPGDLPGGGTAQTHWTWRLDLVLESPTLAFPDNRIVVTFWLDTLLFTDGRLAYVVGLYFRTTNRANSLNALNLLFFEDGPLPHFASPCEPDVFPLPISLRQDGFALELQVEGFV